jgi:hypothetical protein
MTKQLTSREDIIKHMDGLLQYCIKYSNRVRSSAAKRENERVVKFYEEALYYLKDEDKKKIEEKQA